MTFDMLMETEAAFSYDTLPIRSQVEGSRRDGRVFLGRTDDLSLRVRAAPARSAIADFHRLASKWERETAFISSPSEKYLHPSYARIMGMGMEVVPLILRRIQHTPGDWFYALRSITGENPVKPRMAGRMDLMTAAWLNWARRQHISF